MKDLKSGLFLILMGLGLSFGSLANDGLDSLVESFLASQGKQVAQCIKLVGQQTCSASTVVRALDNHGLLPWILNQYCATSHLVSIYHNINMQVHGSEYTRLVAVSHYLAQALRGWLQDTETLLHILSSLPDPENSILLDVIRRLHQATTERERTRISWELLEDIQLGLNQFSHEEIAFLVALATGRPVLLVNTHQAGQIIVVELHSSQGQVIVTPITYDLTANTQAALQEVLAIHLQNTEIHLLVNSDNQLLPVINLTPDVVEQPMCTETECLTPALWHDMRTGATRELLGTDGGRAGHSRPRIKSRKEPKLNPYKVRNIREKWKNRNPKSSPKPDGGYSRLKLAGTILAPLGVVTYLSLSESARNILWTQLCGQQKEYGQCIYDITSGLINQLSRLGSSGYKGVCGDWDVTACQEYYRKKVFH